MPIPRLGLAALLVAIVALAGCTSSEAGWTYAPPPSETPVPSVQASPEPGSPGTSPAPGSPASSPAPGSPAATGGAGGTLVQVSASGIKFEQSTLDVPADTPFTLEFANNDNGIPHDVDIRDSAGTTVFKTDTFNGVETRTFDVPGLPAAAYQFICSVHPATMIIDVTVE